MEIHAAQRNTPLTSSPEYGAEPEAEHAVVCPDGLRMYTAERMLVEA